MKLFNLFILCLIAGYCIGQNYPYNQTKENHSFYTGATIGFSIISTGAAIYNLAMLSGSDDKKTTSIIGIGAGGLQLFYAMYYKKNDINTENFNYNSFKRINIIFGTIAIGSSLLRLAIPSQMKIRKVNADVKCIPVNNDIALGLKLSYTIK